jgi:hypothetical protein
LVGEALGDAAADLGELVAETRAGTQIVRLRAGARAVELAALAGPRLPS